MATRADPESVACIEAVRAAPLVNDLLDGRLAFEWTTAQLVYDDPAKTLDTTGGPTCCSSRRWCGRSANRRRRSI